LPATLITTALGLFVVITYTFGTYLGLQSSASQQTLILLDGFEVGEGTAGAAGTVREAPGTVSEAPGTVREAPAAVGTAREEGQPRRLYVVRHGERVDFAVGEETSDWLHVAFDQDGM
jgi:hypothetical protein